MPSSEELGGDDLSTRLTIRLNAAFTPFFPPNKPLVRLGLRPDALAATASPPGTFSCWLPPAASFGRDPTPLLTALGPHGLCAKDAVFILELMARECSGMGVTVVAPPPCCDRAGLPAPHPYIAWLVVACGVLCLGIAAPYLAGSGGGPGFRGEEVQAMAWTLRAAGLLLLAAAWLKRRRVISLCGAINTVAAGRLGDVLADPPIAAILDSCGLVAWIVPERSDGGGGEVASSGGSSSSGAVNLTLCFCLAGGREVAGGRGANLSLVESDPHAEHGGSTSEPSAADYYHYSHSGRSTSGRVAGDTGGSGGGSIPRAGRVRMPRAPKLSGNPIGRSFGDDEDIGGGRESGPGGPVGDYSGVLGEKGPAVGSGVWAPPQSRISDPKVHLLDTHPAYTFESDAAASPPDCVVSPHVVPTTEASSSSSITSSNGSSVVVVELGEGVEAPGSDAALLHRSDVTTMPRGDVTPTLAGLSNLNSPLMCPSFDCVDGAATARMISGRAFHSATSTPLPDGGSSSGFGGSAGSVCPGFPTGKGVCVRGDAGADEAVCSW